MQALSRLNFLAIFFFYYHFFQQRQYWNGTLWFSVLGSRFAQALKKLRRRIVVAFLCLGIHTVSQPRGCRGLGRDSIRWLFRLKSLVPGVTNTTQLQISKQVQSLTGFNKKDEDTKLIRLYFIRQFLSGLGLSGKIKLNVRLFLEAYGRKLRVLTTRSPVVRLRSILPIYTNRYLGRSRDRPHQTRNYSHWGLRLVSAVFGVGF